MQLEQDVLKFQKDVQFKLTFEPKKGFKDDLYEATLFYDGTALIEKKTQVSCRCFL